MQLQTFARNAAVALLGGAWILGQSLAVGDASRSPETRSTVDLVLCLDASNSMDGLIQAAKVKLWAIVNDLARAKPTPRLRVALLSYGNDGYPSDGWVRMDCGFTSDLDAVYAKLNAITTNGGTEYVARVVREAVTALDWTAGNDALKLVFVAGNEPATQDPKFGVPGVFKQAIATGIQVNTIYCGSPSNGEAAGWRDAAAYADGQFSSIDQDKGIVHIPAPMDGRLAELSGALNQTYIGYGALGEKAKASQAAQDALAEQAGRGASAGRALSKAGKLYDCGVWDLVDASEKEGFDLKKMKEEDLPDDLRKLDPESRAKYLEQKARERKGIQEEIQKLSRERDEFVQAEMKKTGQKGDKAFDEAILRAIRKQAEAKGIRFD